MSFWGGCYEKSEESYVYGTGINNDAWTGGLWRQKTAQSGARVVAGESGLMSENKVENAKTIVNTTVFQKDENFGISGLQGGIGNYMTVNDSIYIGTNEGPDDASTTDSTQYGTMGGVVITEDII